MLVSKIDPNATILYDEGKAWNEALFGTSAPVGIGSMLISVSFWKSMWRSSEKGNLKGDGLTRGGVYVLGP